MHTMLLCHGRHAAAELDGGAVGQYVADLCLWELVDEHEG